MPHDLAGEAAQVQRFHKVSCFCLFWGSQHKQGETLCRWPATQAWRERGSSSAPGGAQTCAGVARTRRGQGTSATLDSAPYLGAQHDGAVVILFRQPDLGHEETISSGNAELTLLKCRHANLAALVADRLNRVRTGG